MSKINEIKYNNFGSEMIVDKYRKYSDIDVYFPKYKWTAKHKTYKNFKESYIKEIADKYQDIIPEKLYIAMYNYEIEYND